MKMSLRGIGVFAGSDAPTSSPAYRRGWLDGAAYITEALDAGESMESILIVLGVVEDEAKPKNRRFTRRRTRGGAP
jgi:hypothetical protein